MKNLMPFANWDSIKILSSFKWISTYAWQQTISRAHSSVPPHLILALADHFEPYILPHNLGVYASRTEQLRRVDFGTLIWPHFGRLIWPHLIYSDRSSYPVPASRDGEGDGQETQGGTV